MTIKFAYVLYCLCSVQNLLSEKVSPSLHNIEVVLNALGLEVQVVNTGAPLSRQKSARVRAGGKPETG